ncbi:MAG: Glu-tRNA(Gln) amidotransferase subunit GatE [Candidatus Aminicenantes bacterium]|nr:Glu-tRNA(Gln) amidotransferase subunit GatE [Candidatus Aminicenantes bacterium]
MPEEFDPENQFNNTKKAVGYIPRKEASQKHYDRVGFKSGLEVHQQLKTKKKLFCNCPAGVYNSKKEYDAEIIRHMRPTLSELGEYDGTALMEFKTKKEIVYRIKNETACTYDIDDTPPFPLNREALDIALEISLLCKLNIVGEVHIIRKQYLDGSIPTGFQRTAILGVEGEIQLRHKKVRLIQLSLEEDSCREISDIRHVRKYQTDRLGMPLIETVTYPDFKNPDEVREGAEYIRFLNRSTGKVRTGIGSGREDVNVSCRGGTRVEIKGVSHNKWIPELTHNEVFRQWSLLRIRDELKKRIASINRWAIHSKPIIPHQFRFKSEVLKNAVQNGWDLVAVNLPRFKGMLSHFTQPGQMFADELSDRLKVIACIEKPNMVHSESVHPDISPYQWSRIQKMLNSKNHDAQLVLWGPEQDIPTALETIEERCRLALEAVPRESRKALKNGTTVFERVLPGPDRMYPDTDSSPIPLKEDYIDKIRKRLPVDVSQRIEQLKRWNVPEDTFTYLLRNNLVPLMQRIARDLKVDPRFLGTLLGHTLKHVQGQDLCSHEFSYERIRQLFKFLYDRSIEFEMAKEILPLLCHHPGTDLNILLKKAGFEQKKNRDILARIPEVIKDFVPYKRVDHETRAAADWIMGRLRPMALGNMPLSELRKEIQKKVENRE